MLINIWKIISNQKFQNIIVLKEINYSKLKEKILQKEDKLNQQIVI